MGLSPLTFTGASKYSSDLQTILNRAVQIAQIPVKSLQNQDSDALQRKSLWAGVRTSVAGLAQGLSALNPLAARSAVTATSSDASVVTAVAVAGATATSYSIDSITSIASAATERSAVGYANSATTPVATVGPLDLVVGSTHKRLTPTSNNLVAIRDAINSSGLGVTASIITAPNANYLSVAANSPGATTLQLIDDPEGAATNLLTSSNQGTDAVFKLNGIEVRQKSNTVNSLIPGAVLTLHDKSAAPVTVTLATDRQALGNSINAVVAGYSAVRNQLLAQVGGNAGLLTGNPIIGQLQDVLRRLVSPQQAGLGGSLSDLGVEFSSAGEISFKQDTLNSLPEDALRQSFQWLGSKTSGLSSFASTLSRISDPVSGSIKAEQDGLDRSDKNFRNQIQTLNDRISVMQTNLMSRLQKADSLLAALEQQQTQLGASVQGLNLVLYGKNQSQ